MCGQLVQPVTLFMLLEGRRCWTIYVAARIRRAILSARAISVFRAPAMVEDPPGNSFQNIFSVNVPDRDLLLLKIHGVILNA